MAGVCVTATLADVTTASEPDVNLSVCDPAPSIRRLANVAAPSTAFTVAVPTSVPVPLAMAAVTATVEPLTTSLAPSRTVTTGWPVKLSPDTAPLGSVCIASATGGLETTRL